MIYRVQIKSSDIPYISIIKKLNSLGEYCFSDKSFYINTAKSTKELSKIFKTSTIVKIKTISDLSECSELVKNWCKKIMEKQAIEQYETSEAGQARMKIIMEYLNEIEKKRKEDEENANSEEKPISERGIDSSAGGKQVEKSI